MPLPMVLEDVLTRWKVKIDAARRNGLTWSEAVSLIYDGLGEAFQVMAAITALSGPEKKQLVMQFADQLFEFAIAAIPPTGAYGWIVWLLRSQIKSILLDAFGAFIEKLYRDKVRGDA